VRAGDSLVVTKLDRPARSVPDARSIGDSLIVRGLKLSFGGAICAWPTRSARCSSPILATFAEFEVDLLRTREGMAIARANGRLNGKPPKLNAHQQAHLVRLYRDGSHRIRTWPICSASLGPPTTASCNAPSREQRHRSCSVGHLVTGPGCVHAYVDGGPMMVVIVKAWAGGATLVQAIDVSYQRRTAARPSLAKRNSADHDDSGPKV